MLIMNKDEYANLVKKHSLGSHKVKDLFAAFLTGGLICTLGQILAYSYELAGAEKETAFALASITLIFFTAILTGLGVFDKIAKFGGAGTLVPITGFANAMVSPAVEFRAEGMIYGVGVKTFSIAGPVIVYGVAASALWGLIIIIMNACGVNI